MNAGKRKYGRLVSAAATLNARLKPGLRVSLPPCTLTRYLHYI